MAALDLNGLLENIQTIFEIANTTTATTDLSNNMTNRVQTILKTSPDRIPPQASFFPYVTCYVENKTITPETIAKTQGNAKRSAEIEISIVGCIWNNNLSTVDEDPADKDCNYLMENIEQIIRENQTLVPSSGGTTTSALWSMPTEIGFYSGVLDEQTHLRAGVLGLKARVFY